MKLLFSLALLTLISACGGSGGSAKQDSQNTSEKPEISPLSISIADDSDSADSSTTTSPLHYLSTDLLESATQQSLPVNRLDQDVVVNGPLEDIVVEMAGLLYQVNQQDGANYLESWLPAEDAAFDRAELGGISSSADIYAVVAVPQSSEILSLGATSPYECPPDVLCKPTPYAFVNDKITFSWTDVADPTFSYQSASIEIDGQYLASESIVDFLIVVSHFVPSLLSSFQWDFSSDFERSELLQQASLGDISSGIYEAGELQAYISQGCYSERDESSFILGNMYNVTVVSLSSKTILHNTCISAELAAISLEKNNLGITLKSGGEHQFIISETHVDYIGPK